MKKNILNAALIGEIVLGCTQFSMKACANDMPYEPVFENVPITESMTTTAKAEPAQSTMTPVAKTASESTPAVNNAANAAESGNLQSALMQIDGAQVEIRNQLIQYKSEYTNIDNQYKAIKQQRKLKAKQVKETEKKIKSLDSTKEKIRKNMN